MIKTSAIFSAHAIHRFLRNILIAFIVLIVALFIWLLAGIKFDTFKVANYHIDGLYIKLDKKLVLKADNIIIPKSKAEPSFTSVDETFDRIKYTLTFFQSVDLKNIFFENNTLSMKFKDDYLKIASKDYEIIGTVKREGNIIKATIPFLNLKKHQVALNGNFAYDLKKDILATEGNFTLSDASGTFKASKRGNDIDFALRSDTFKDLRNIIDKFKLRESVRSWIVDRVQADQYRLSSLSGRGKIEEGKFKLDFNALKGEVLFTDAKIYFKEALPAVTVPRLILTYSEGGLYFDLQEPLYEGISLNGSTVSILNLLNADTNLKLKIRAHTAFDSKLKEILEAYNLHLPLDQKSGKANLLFMADLSLKSKYQDYFVNVDFDKSEVMLQKIKLPIEKGIVQYHKGMITIKDITLKDAYYAGDLNGQIDLNEKKADLVFDAKRIVLGEKEKPFFVLKDRTLPFELRYKENIEVEIPSLHTKLISDKNETHIFLTDLGKIKPYLPDPGPIEQGGSVDISTKDFEIFTFNGVLKRRSCFLYEKENQCKSRVPFEGKVIPGDLDFYAFEKRLHYNQASSRINIENLNIDIEAFLQTSREGPAKAGKGKKPKAKKGKSLVIIGKKSNLRYGDYSLHADSYDIEVKPNGNVKALGSAQSDIIKFDKKQELISIQAFRIKDKTLHPLINFKGLQHGRYTLKNWGDPQKTMKGEIIVEGGVMRDFKAYNNTLAFINTVPALASLKNPGYSEEGFTIEEGVAEYRMIKKDKIIFDSIYIKGASATIAGTGEIDLKKNSIKLDLAIQTAREIGKLVGSLPLVGYIITGGDKSITFGLEIAGALDDPKVTTSPGGDILSLPLKILKRALESPEYILNR